MEEALSPVRVEASEGAPGPPYAAGRVEVAGRAAEGPRAGAGGGLGALRALHHSLARAEAEGASLSRLAALAADLAGRPWGVAEVERLTASPAFRELVASYRRAA